MIDGFAYTQFLILIRNARASINDIDVIGEKSIPGVLRNDAQ